MGSQEAAGTDPPALNTHGKIVKEGTANLQVSRSM